MTILVGSKHAFLGVFVSAKTLGKDARNRFDNERQQFQLCHLLGSSGL